MGLYSTDKCIFTDLPAQHYEDGQMRDALEYIIQVGNNKHLIRITCEALEWNNSNDFFKKNKYLFEALLLNNKWFEDEKDFITEDKLKQLLNDRITPKTPKEKLENLFIFLSDMQKEDGAPMNLSESLIKKFFKKNYLKSIDEFIFYLKTMEELDWIKVISIQPIVIFKITYKGLCAYINLKEEGQLSNKCFIAMSFKTEAKEIRNAIKEAVENTGFEPVLIDERHLDSEKTINDEIIANLKKSKFCIADFTYNSCGVYFESGFALGQGKKVIYTIRQDHLHDAHFDTRSFQHIVYDTPEDLKTALINKIEAWVK